MKLLKSTMTPPESGSYLVLAFGRDFPLFPEARLRGLLVCAALARGFWFLVSGFSCLALRLHSPLPNPTAVCPSLPDSVLPCFRVSVSVFRGQTHLGTLHGTDRFVAPHPAFSRHRAGNGTGTGTDATNILRGQATQPVSCSLQSAVRQDKGQGKDPITVQHARDSDLKPASPRLVMSDPAVTVWSSVLGIPYRRLTLRRRNYE